MNVPKHIGVILDGNRRFAKRLMLKPWKGHEWGAKKFRKFLEWCHEIGVDEITAYCFSIQNFNRPKEEFDYLMKIFEKEMEHMLTEEKQKELAEKGIKVSIIGKLHMLPARLQELARKVMETTKDNKKKKVNMAIAYGGREEILEAVQKIADEVEKGLKPEEISAEKFKEKLWMKRDPDLIIRTGGEHRTSNFLPWQGTYAELMFIDKYWPEFEKEDFIKCIEQYSNRDRRFGK